MLVTLSGMVTPLRLLQSVNAPKPTLVKPFPNSRLDRFTQPENAPLPISLTLSGITASVMLSHPAKALSPMLVTLSAIVTVSKYEQSSNVFLPITVTPFSITMFFTSRFIQGFK